MGGSFEPDLIYCRRAEDIERLQCIIRLTNRPKVEQEWEQGGDEQRDCGGETQKRLERTNLQGQIQKLPGDAFFLILIARLVEKLSKVIVIILFFIDNMIQVDDPFFSEKQQ